MKEYFGVDWGNHIPWLQAQVWCSLRTCCQVFFEENLLTNFPSPHFQSLTSSLSSNPPTRSLSISSSISLRILCLCLHRRWFDITSAIVALFAMPRAITPRSPTTSLRHPIWDHTSCQNEVWLPLPTSTCINYLAILLIFSSFFHIQDPKFVLTEIDQKDPFLIK